MWPLTWSVAVLAAAGTRVVAYTDAENSSVSTYHEKLTFTPMPRNAVLASFDFATKSQAFGGGALFGGSGGSDYGNHADSLASFDLFPRSLGQILTHTNTHELHLRFTQGWWDQHVWGAQPDSGAYAGGIGVELWAWVEAENSQEAQSHWNKLANLLSGLFCASLNFIDAAHTSMPQATFQRLSHSQPGESSQLFLLHGALPREPVCTENLTPFLKLLPCKGKAGLSSVLDGHKLFDAQWQGMAIDVATECEDDGLCSYSLRQRIDAVLDVPRALRRKSSPVPTPVPEHELRCDGSRDYANDWTCFPLGDQLDMSWTLQDLFGKPVVGSCPLALTNELVFDGTSDWQVQFTNDENAVQPSSIVGDTFTYDLEPGSIDLHLTTLNSSSIPAIAEPPIYVERSLTGFGDSGGLRTVFANPSAEPVHFTYFESLPWFMRLYLHTLDFSLKSGSESALESSSPVKNMSYSLGVDRLRPSQLELELVIPAHSSVVMSYDFDKTLLYIEEYPPDANHGFEIPPSVLTTLGPHPFTIRSTSLLLSLPTPDFSMPYNVIILSSTVMAMAFGTIFHLLVKDIVTDDEAELAAAKRPINKIIAVIRALLLRRVDKEYE